MCSLAFSLHRLGSFTSALDEVRAPCPELFQSDLKRTRRLKWRDKWTTCSSHAGLDLLWHERVQAAEGLRAWISLRTVPHTKLPLMLLCTYLWSQNLKMTAAVSSSGFKNSIQIKLWNWCRELQLERTKGSGCFSKLSFKSVAGHKTREQCN